MGWKYTKEKLEKIIPKSKSWADVCRAFGASLHGGLQSHIKKRAILYGIDFSHFKTERGGWNRGLPSPKRKNASEILIKREKGNRKKAHLLRRALAELGIPNQCEICLSSTWMDLPIRLEVDHINGNPLDDRADNLRLLCPNCHSQTGNYKNKGRHPAG